MQGVTTQHCPLHEGEVCFFITTTNIHVLLFPIFTRELQLLILLQLLLQILLYLLLLLLLLLQSQVQTATANSGLEAHVKSSELQIATYVLF